MSVPRLELTTAVLAAKMTNFVVNELDISFSSVFVDRFYRGFCNIYVVRPQDLLTLLQID